MGQLAIVSILILLAVLTRRYVKRHRLPLPPGPPGHPLWGNLEDLKTKNGEHRWAMYKRMSRQYGDVFYAKVFGDETVVLNSYKATTELMEKRSRNYSDRPRIVMTDDLMGWDWNFIHMTYGDRWRLHRKTFHQYFQPRNLPQFNVVQSDAAKALMRQLADTPEDFYEHVKHHAGFIILKLVYGYDMKHGNDPYVELATNAVGAITQVVNHGQFAVDYIPWLKHIPSWFPGAEFKRKAEAWRPLAEGIREMPWKMMKEDIAENGPSNSFASQNLERFAGEPEMEEVIKNCAGIAYIAGSDVIVVSIHSLILAMILYPHVLERAQKELDDVVGSSRLPEFEDRPNLPYIEAILAEILRWHPAVPLAVPHRSLEDDVYEGHLIPAGATIVPNAGAILHDEDLYGNDVDDFNPERHLKKPGKPLPPHPREFAFGFGRRICPGRHVAEHSLWIAIAYLLWAFDFKKALDSSGNEVDPVVNYHDGLISHPDPFKCRITPRFKEVLDLIA